MKTSCLKSRTYIQYRKRSPINAIESDESCEEPPSVFRWEESGVAPPLYLVNRLPKTGWVARHLPDDPTRSVELHGNLRIYRCQGGVATTSRRLAAGI